MSEDPIVRALVLADRVYVERDTNKYVIAGTFNRISAQKYPTAWAAGAAIYYAITNFRRGGNIEIVFREASTATEIFKLEGQVEIQELDPLQVLEGTVPIPPFPLNHPGTYEFALLFEQRLLACVPLQAVEVKP